MFQSVEIRLVIRVETGIVKIVNRGGWLVLNAVVFCLFALHKNKNDEEQK